MLKLFRPIVFFDIESTGLNVEEDRIISIGLVKQFPEGKGRLSKEYLMNPGRPIPAESTEIHGITDGAVALQPLFEVYAQQLLDFLMGCDVAGFNLSHFDVPILWHHFNRAGLTWDVGELRIVDVGTIFKRREARTLSAAVQFYTDKPHTNAHTALSDANASLDVLLGQFRKYPDLPTDVSELALYSNHDNRMCDVSGKFYIDAKDVICFNFGKYKNKPALEHPDFLEWMHKRVFPVDTALVVERLLDEHYESLGRDDEEVVDALFGNDSHKEEPTH